MRSSITLFEDQYQFCKELKSKRLLRAFVEYMFEDIEPEGLKGIEKTVFNSLRNRMENSKKIHDGNSKGGQASHGGGRKKNTSSDLNQKNKSKTSQTTTQKQVENNEEEVEEEVIKENKKRKFLEFVYLTDDEYTKLVEEYGKRITDDQIQNLNNYIGQNGKDKYKNHYYTILAWNRKAGFKKLTKKEENETGIYDLPF